MTHHLPPEAWRSEAFAEDLFDNGAEPEAPPPSWWLQTARHPLLGLLPMVAVATASLATAVWVAA